MLIGREELASLIPHQGSMCLLDAVSDWDETLIRCSTGSHRLADNPLRRDGRLGGVHALEYGAQAMAVHGALLARRQGRRLGVGFLAAGRDVQLLAERLDTIAEPLTVEAERLHGEGDNLIYSFRVSAGERLLASGRVTVMSAEETA